MTIPAWYADKLGPSRRGVRAERCPRCRATVLTGFDDDVAALKVSIDPIPLTAMGEALALLGNRSTHALKVHKSGLALWRRDHWQIAGQPAGTLTGYTKADVVAQHRCGESLQPFQAASVYPPPVTTRGGADDQPPF